MSNNLKLACLELFRETFEGVAPGSNGTWFVQGREAVLPSIQALTPEQASTVYPGGRATVGAHVNHLCYYLHLFNVHKRGEEEPSDWEGSWKMQTFDAKAWKDVQDRTLAEYEEATQWYRLQAESDSDFATEEKAISAIANIAHAAFHLGAIRALIPIVQ